MAWLRQLVLAPLLAATAAVAALAQDDEEPNYYICIVERTGDFGSITYWLEVPVDGSAPFHRINWAIPRREQGLRLWVQQDLGAPVDGQLDDRSWVHIYFDTPKRIRDEVRIEIRRQPGERYPSEFSYAGPYKRPFLWHDRPFYYVETQARWGELRAWMAGRERLTFALVKRDGTVMDQDRLDAATLAGVAEALAAVTPELEAMAADFRTRCQVPEPIVITSEPLARP